MTIPASTDRTRTFERQGFLGPVRLLDPNRCGALVGLLERVPPPVTWSKGGAVRSREYYSLGCLPALTDLLEEILGPNVMLWGCSLVHREPGRVHPWHTDIESSGAGPGTVTVWIGLRNVDRRSSLQVLSRSHRFGVTPQELGHEVGKTRKQITRRDALGWAREIDHRCELVEFDMGDGEAVLFDGRLWHGTDNTNSEGVRSALLLQYATPDRPIRIPDFEKVDFPFRFLEEPRPPCLMVRGHGQGNVNRIVQPPTTKSWIGSLELPLAMEERTGMGRRYVYADSTPCVEHMSCHASVLAPGGSPHEPHGHDEEEVLVVLDGRAELVVEDGSGTRRVEPVARGDLAYYPAGCLHTIRNPGDRPVTYLMFKWRNGSSGDGSGRRLSSRVVRFAGDGAEPPRSGWVGRPLFEGPTRCLRWLHCHRTTMAPGAGYAPHVDGYDVGIVLLEGTVDVLGRRLDPGDVAFCAAGEPHGMRNVGEGPAVYLVFEFHSEMRIRWGWRARRFVRNVVVPRVPRPVKTIVKRVVRVLPL